MRRGDLPNRGREALTRAGGGGVSEAVPRAFPRRGECQLLNRYFLSNIKPMVTPRQLLPVPRGTQGRPPSLQGPASRLPPLVPHRSVEPVQSAVPIEVRDRLNLQGRFNAYS